MSGRRRSALALAIAITALLAGCGAIPVTGPVQTTGAQFAKDPAIVFAPRSPVEGATPQDIVAGFIQAASAGGDYRVAKEFLTSAFAKSWRPGERTLVHEQGWATTQSGPGRVRLQVPVTARVESDGTYTPSRQSKPLDFRLAQVRGQWRIASGPNGIVLTEPVFQRIFKPVTLQFWDPTFSWFVPDVRWLPPGRQGPSAIAAALLAGPAAPIASTVTASAFPLGTRLRAPVSTVGGLTSVSITAPDGAVDRRTTDHMQQQLAQALLVPVAAMRLTINGVAQPAARPADVREQSALTPLVLSGKQFGALTAGSVKPDGVLSARVVAQRPRAITVSIRQRLAAVLTGSGQVAVIGATGPARVVDRRAGLVAPTLDQRGWVYSVPANDPTRMIAATASGRTVELQTDLSGARVRSIEASPDGTRMLLLSESSDGPAAVVAGIERDGSGVPTGLTRVRYPVALGGSVGIDGTWVDGSTVAVLTSGTDLQSVVSQQLGGISGAYPQLSHARSIAGLTAGEPLAAVQDTGDLLTLQSNVWQPVFARSPKVDVLAVQR